MKELKSRSPCSLGNKSIYKQQRMNKLLTQHNELHMYNSQCLHILSANVAKLIARTGDRLFSHQTGNNRLARYVSYSNNHLVLLPVLGTETLAHRPITSHLRLPTGLDTIASTYAGRQLDIEF